MLLVSLFIALIARGASSETAQTTASTASSEAPPTTTDLPAVNCRHVLASTENRSSTGAPSTAARFADLFHSGNIGDILNIRTVDGKNSYEARGACVYALFFDRSHRPQVRYNHFESNGNAYEVGAKPDDAEVLNVDDLWNTSARMNTYCNSSMERHYTGVAFATRLYLSGGSPQHDVISVFWMCCVRCEHISGLGFEPLKMGITLGYMYTALLPMNVRFRLNNTAEFYDPTMDYTVARCAQKFGKLIVADMPICDDYTRVVNTSGTHRVSTPVLAGLRPVKSRTVKYNSTERRIRVQQNTCVLNIHSDMWNISMLNLNVTCNCLNTHDKCINATYFGDMTHCPRMLNQPADRILYNDRNDVTEPFDYTEMGMTESCRFEYEAQFNSSGVLWKTRMSFSECNNIGKKRCSPWQDDLANKTLYEGSAVDDWRALQELRCAFTSAPGECPLVNVSDIKPPRYYRLECRCNDGFCVLKAATLLFGGNMLVNSSYYYGKQNGAVVERYVLDGLNAMPVHRLASKGSCELTIFKFSDRSTNCSTVEFDEREFANFTTLQPLVHCTCNDRHTQTCNDVSLRENAKELFSLIGQCRNESQFENYHINEEQYPPDRFDWGPPDIVWDDLFLCAHDVHTLSSDPGEEAGFGYLVKKSSLTNFPLLNRNFTLSDLISCQDRFLKAGQVSFCTCFAFNGVCNAWPDMFGKHIRKLLRGVAYAEKVHTCGRERCREKGCFAMQGRCVTSGTKPVVKGCRAPLNFTGSQLSASFERFGRWDPFVCEDHKDECVLVGSGGTARLLCCCRQLGEACIGIAASQLLRLPFLSAEEVDTLPDSNLWTNRIERMKSDGILQSGQ